MENETTYKVFQDYLISQGIKIVDESKICEGNCNELSEKDIIEHLCVISKFHKVVLNFNNYKIRFLKNDTGKKIEKYKIYIKKSKKHLKILNQKSDLTLTEKFILDNGEEVIKRAETCISFIYDSNYFEIIKRSMDREEICLGNSDPKNIVKKHNIEIVSLSDCVYNMFEMDAIFYFNKLKKSKKNLDWNIVIEKYCDFEGFNYSSKNFIMGFLSFPNEYMKWWNRYRVGIRELTDEEYCRVLMDAKIKDEKILI